jgi:ATP-binding cassette subfamily F protein 3
MNAGMEEEKAPKKVEYIFDAPPLSSRDKAKIERNRRKEDRQREVSSSPPRMPGYSVP